MAADNHEETATPEEPLSAKAERFCAEYVIDLNGAGAARRAGYSVKSAKDIAHELLHDPRIQARIDENRKRTAELAGLTALGVALELKRVLYADMGAFIRQTKPGSKPGEQIPIEGVPVEPAGPRLELKALNRTDTRAIQSIRESEGGRVSIKLYDKIAAAERVNRMFGWDSPEQMRLSLVTEHEDALMGLE